MEARNDINRADEVLLPGFRFHPTDEELIAFYLKRKVQQKPIAIELIRQLDIYKYDPWDLPNLAPTTGEKEWYFYCPRDRKYKNSSRPNRVTAAGFWKATGTDRPVYSTEGTKCIGLKKSLVFYKGRAAKGTKTDWMMHEFRLPSMANSSKEQPLDMNIHPNDSWAICRIFKKTCSMAQRSLHQSMAHSLPNTKSMDTFSFPYSTSLDINNSISYPLMDLTPFQPPMLTNLSNVVAADHLQLDNSFYVGTDNPGISDTVDISVDTAWDSPTCPSEVSRSWSSENCFNNFDELMQFNVDLD